MEVIEKLIAGFVERSCKSYVTTIIGVLSMIVFGVNTFGSMIPADWYTTVNLVTVVLAGVALILAKDSGQPTTGIPVVKMLGMILLMIGIASMCAPFANAQTAAQVTQVMAPAPANASNGFAGASEAVAIRYNGEWSAGTHVTESYDFLDLGKTKGNHIYLEGHEVLAPTPGFSIYAGGIKIEPDLSALLKKSNIPASNFGVFLQAAAGNGVPSSGGSHISFLAGGGVRYQVTTALTWQTLDAQWIRYGANNGAAISTGLSFIFGK